MENVVLLLATYGIILARFEPTAHFFNKNNILIRNISVRLKILKWSKTVTSASRGRFFPDNYS